jgi:hypothetical protein
VSCRCAGNAEESLLAGLLADGGQTGPTLQHLAHYPVQLGIFPDTRSRYLMTVCGPPAGGGQLVLQLEQGKQLPEENLIPDLGPFSSGGLCIPQQRVDFSL